MKHFPVVRSAPLILAFFCSATAMAQETPPGALISELQLSQRERNMLSRSDQGLQARMLPNRAIALDLQGRFRNLAAATIEPESAGVVMSCSVTDPTDSHFAVASEDAE